MADETLVSFLLPSVHDVGSVDLYGSWDNFRVGYPMQRDRQKGRGHWYGTHRFKDLICHGDPSDCSLPEDGGLRMGGTYWYYYKRDGDAEFHNPVEPSTSSCPMLPGQTVNVLEVPFLSTSAVTPCDTLTMDVQLRWMSPKAPPRPPPRRKQTSPKCSTEPRRWWFSQRLGRLQTAVVEHVIGGHPTSHLSDVVGQRRRVLLGRRAITAAGPCVGLQRASQPNQRDVPVEDALSTPELTRLHATVVSKPDSVGSTFCNPFDEQPVIREAKCRRPVTWPCVDLRAISRTSVRPFGSQGGRPVRDHDASCFSRPSYSLWPDSCSSTRDLSSRVDLVSLPSSASTQCGIGSEAALAGDLDESAALSCHYAEPIEATYGPIKDTPVTGSIHGRRSQPLETLTLPPPDTQLDREPDCLEASTSSDTVSNSARSLWTPANASPYESATNGFPSSLLPDLSISTLHAPLSPRKTPSWGTSPDPRLCLVDGGISPLVMAPPPPLQSPPPAPPRSHSSNVMSSPPPPTRYYKRPPIPITTPSSNSEIRERDTVAGAEDDRSSYLITSPTRFYSSAASSSQSPNQALQSPSFLNQDPAKTRARPATRRTSTRSGAAERISTACAKIRSMTSRRRKAEKSSPSHPAVDSTPNSPAVITPPASPDRVVGLGLFSDETTELRQKEDAPIGHEPQEEGSISDLRAMLENALGGSASGTSCGHQRSSSDLEGFGYLGAFIS